MKFKKGSKYTGNTTGIIVLCTNDSDIGDVQFSGVVIDAASSGDDIGGYATNWNGYVFKEIPETPKEMNNEKIIYVCPLCESDNISYLNTDINSSMTLLNPHICNDCGVFFKPMLVRSN